MNRITIEQLKRENSNTFTQFERLEELARVGDITPDEKRKLYQTAININSVLTSPYAYQV